jgi:hypothetical protein
MKNRILSDFNIVKMNKNSLTLEDKGSHDKVFITRDLFNNLDSVEEIRITDPLENGTKWVEGKYWSRF